MISDKITIPQIKKLNPDRSITVRAYVRSTLRFWMEFSGTPSEVVEEIKDNLEGGMRRDLIYSLYK